MTAPNARCFFNFIPALLLAIMIASPAPAWQDDAEEPGGAATPLELYQAVRQAIEDRDSERLFRLMEPDAPQTFRDFFAESLRISDLRNQISEKYGEEALTELDREQPGSMPPQSLPVIRPEDIRVEGDKAYLRANPRGSHFMIAHGGRWHFATPKEFRDQNKAAMINLMINQMRSATERLQLTIDSSIDYVVFRMKMFDRGQRRTPPGRANAKSSLVEYMRLTTYQYYSGEHNRMTCCRDILFDLAREVRVPPEDAQPGATTPSGVVARAFLARHDLDTEAIRACFEPQIPEVLEAAIEMHCRYLSLMAMIEQRWGFPAVEAYLLVHEADFPRLRLETVLQPLLRTEGDTTYHIDSGEGRYPLLKRIDKRWYIRTPDNFAAEDAADRLAPSMTEKRRFLDLTETALRETEDALAFLARVRGGGFSGER